MANMYGNDPFFNIDKITNGHLMFKIMEVQLYGKYVRK